MTAPKPEELHRLLVEWNPKPTPYPGDRSITLLFSEWVAASPDAPAVVHGRTTWSYRELDRFSDRLAVRLQAAGVRRGDFVAVALERSHRLPAAFLAVLKAGGSYLPLDPDYPLERLAFLLADSGAAVVLCDPATAPRLEKVLAERESETACPQLLHVTGREKAAEGLPRDPGTGPEDPACLIYTSGSTGRPKGVMVPHRAVIRTVRDNRYAGYGPGDRMGHTSSVSFDAASIEIWAPLLNGGCVAVLDREDVVVPARLAAAIRDLELNTMVLATALFHQTVREVPDGFQPLRELLVGGEAMDGEWARRALEASAPARIVNGYGPTESATIATWHAPDSLPPGAPVPIGVPVANTTVYLIDGDGEPVSIGEEGELWIGGDGLAHGYHRRPSLTAERFVPDPFGDRPGARLYRTGDRARWRPDGLLEFAGRIDRQVKVRGLRVELEEIETVLANHPGVGGACVVTPRDATGDRYLAAYVVGTDGAPPAAAELETFLADRLPAFMVPDAWVPLEAFPLTPNGKVDRDALPEPPHRAGGGGPLSSEAERTLAALWSELLGVEEVGPEDDFFTLGGHSLLVGRLATRLRSDLGVELSLSQIYAEPTLAAMARRVERAEASSLPPLTKAARSKPLPLSFPQERIWFLNELAPGNVAYNTQVTLDLEGPLDARAFRATLQTIVERHEIFRTRFYSIDGSPVQEPRPAPAIELPLIDLSGFPEEEQQAEEERILQREIRRPFDLDRPPLARWHLLRRGPRRHTLLQVEHHFVHDGWSLAVLLREVEALYPALAAGVRPTLEPPTLQYADFAVWQRSWLQGPTLQRHLDYWTGRLTGAPPTLDLPTDHPRPAVQRFRGHALRLRLPADLGRDLRSLARSHGVTLFNVMLSTFQVLLHRYTGSTDLVLGTAVAARRLAEMEGMIGMVVNTLVLRTDLSGDPSFDELIDRVGRVLQGATEYQDTPLDRLVERLMPQRDLSRNPLFQVMFSFHDSAVPDLELGDVRARLVERHNGSAKADLNIVVIPRAEQRVGRAPRSEDDEAIHLIWEYNSDLFEERTARRLYDHYCNLLRSAVASSRERLSRLAMLSAEERRTLQGWSRGVHPAAREEPDVQVHHRFREHAARRPNAPAVRQDGREVSFGELARRSAALAHRLADLGVGPETPVAIFVPRSPELVVAVLAALEAGAPYLPIDPDYPAARVELLLRDAEVPVLLVGDGMEPRLAELAPDLPAHRFPIPGPDEKGAETPPPRREPLSPEQLAYVIYTSGSTGRPKGVAVSHGALANLVDWHRDIYRVTPDDRTTLLASPGFDASVWEIWPYLASGACLCVPNAEERTDPTALVRFLIREEVSLCFVPTLLAEALLEEEWPERTHLRVLLTGGDALTRRPPEGLPFTLVNHYGPTENAVVGTAGSVAATPSRSSSAAPDIGRPIHRVRTHVVGPDGDVAPPGVPGELLLGGASLARGYVGRPRWTAERFVPDPFGDEPGARLYRTGDRARFDDQGLLEFRGRIDEQVQIRGVRIEPGEVEAVFGRHPGLAEVAVVARRDEGTPLRLVAYAVPATDAPPAPAEMEDFLSRHLPRSMVPSAFVVLDALPRSSHGKIDRAALPVPDRELLAGAPRVAPRNEEEQAVAEIWRQLLGDVEVGIHDDFFSLGGHSLLSTRVVALLNRRFGTSLPLGRFLRQPTVASLARCVREARRESSPEPSAVPWSDPRSVLSRLDELSDAEVESILEQMQDNQRRVQ